jgi:uncharacterized protein YbgA (DUF1722 family)
MAKSPSCGMERIKVHNEQGQLLNRDGRGLFADALMRAYPLMPVEEEGRLHDSGLRENFIERVFAYDDWLQNVAGDRLSPQALIEFHSRHKFQLLAHSEPIYRQLGPLLADLRSAPLEDIARRYIEGFMMAMRQPVSRGSHVNAMLHLLGYLKGSMPAEDKQVLLEQLDAYRRGEVPLVVPMTLLRLGSLQGLLHVAGRGRADGAADLCAQYAVGLRQAADAKQRQGQQPRPRAVPHDVSVDGRGGRLYCRPS